MSYADNPHKEGPPCRGTAPSVTRSIRFTREELEHIERHAQTHRMTPTAVIRAGLKKAGIFSWRRLRLPEGS